MQSACAHGEWVIFFTHHHSIATTPIGMLAIDAPPGQGKTHQPFVHYRCMCSSPGSSATASTKSPPSSTQDQDLDSTVAGTPSAADMNIDNFLASSSSPASSSSHALIVRASPLGHDSLFSEHQHSHNPRSTEEIFASGNSSDEHGSLSLSRLYFCDSCDEIRCPKCTQDEIVCYYCPNCLFDVPTASVKSEKHK